MELYVRYETETLELNDLIARLQKERSEIDKKQANFKKRREKALEALTHWRQKVSNPEEQKEFARRKFRGELAKIAEVPVALLTILAWLAGCFIFIPIYELVNDVPGSSDWSIGGAAILAILVAIFCTKLWLYLHAKSQPEKSIQEQVILAENKLKKVECELVRIRTWIETPCEPEIFARFKANGFQELLEIKRERAKFMAQFRTVNSLPGDGSLDDQNESNDHASVDVIPWEFRMPVQYEDRVKRINSLNQNNAYRNGVADGAAEVREFLREFKIRQTDYLAKIGPIRELQGNNLDDIASKNKFDPTVFQQYKSGWDWGASNRPFSTDGLSYAGENAHDDPQD